ncbi:MAG: FtsW/RodA/SpoVE family cell cycle protein [Kiritimatiellae bacterium]|nr:FtsW/RodA/SpoVE family cell cycle protein [Kiritimatiellia bacterium]
MRNALTALWMVAASLLFFGLVLVYTASTAQRGGAAPVLFKQLIAAAAGLVMGAFCVTVDYRFWRSRAVLAALSAVAIASCLLVFKWDAVNGSRRWINIGGVSLQPSEFARIVMLMALAAWYSAIGPRSGEFVRGVLIPGGVAAAFIAPVLASPDLGATMVMCVGAASVMLAAGVRKRWIVIGGAVAMAVVAVMLVNNENKRARVMVTFNRFMGRATESAAAYHVEQSLEAFARGGMGGRGIGRSIQKNYYLPEANSDFIYAIAAEEFGIGATVSMVVAYMALLVCGIYIAYHANDRFGSFLALGATVTISFEAAFNIGMVTGCLPTKGIALPFASAGGSSLMASMVIVGLLASIGRASVDDNARRVIRDARIKYY